MTLSSPGSETSESIDLAVKGSLPTRSSLSPPPVVPKPPPAPPGNPLDYAPNSPNQVYLNLLILEASLRSQYLHHLARRRKFTFFVVLLLAWNAYFLHRIFDLGGSPYYYIYHLEWLGLLGGCVTAALYYATGLYEKTIVEPRRFVSTANRGLRGFNVKLVKVPFSTTQWIVWWWNWYTFPTPPPPRRPHPSSTASRRLSANTTKPRRLSANTPRKAAAAMQAAEHSHRHAPSIASSAMGRTSSQLAPHPEEAMEDDPTDEIEEYLTGGLHLKLVILPKRFSATFREEWENYRTEYWDKENKSRHKRRKAVKRWYWPLRMLSLRGRAAKKEDIPVTTGSPAVRVRRASVASERRSPSVSSRAGTPEPEGTPTRRRGGSFVAKRRPNMAPGLVPGGKSGDVSDSGSTTTAGTEGRSDSSTVVDKSSPSAGTGKRKNGSKGKGRGRKAAIAGRSADG
ncbi:Spo7-like protein-domain-containing protein [Morchella snyderi]|nr:Spo7-like protein-domain-containing protein [Morchella snyderi]